MVQKFYKSLGFMGIMLVVFATGATLFQWVTTR